jgi:UTP--glucose-1-phosphate uridylyltransferase
MRAIAGDAPKEMLPVAGAPAIDWVLDECAASGVDDILVVTSPGKDALVAHLGGVPGVRTVVQTSPRGLADAIRLGRDFASDEPLAVALPDNIFVAATPALRQVIDGYDAWRTNLVAIVEISAREAARRGATAALDGVRDGKTYHITRIPDKGAKSATFDVQGAAAAYTAVGRFVFLPAALQAIDDVERLITPGAELDDVPLMQWLLARGALQGSVIEGDFLDVGLPSGYEEANARLTASARSALRPRRA